MGNCRTHRSVAPICASCAPGAAPTPATLRHTPLLRHFMAPSPRTQTQMQVHSDAQLLPPRQLLMPTDQPSAQSTRRSWKRPLDAGSAQTPLRPPRPRPHLVLPPHPPGPRPLGHVAARTGAFSARRPVHPSLPAYLLRPPPAPRLRPVRVGSEKTPPRPRPPPPHVPPPSANYVPRRRDVDAGSQTDPVLMPTAGPTGAKKATAGVQTEARGRLNGLTFAVHAHTFRAPDLALVEAFIHVSSGPIARAQAGASGRELTTGARRRGHRGGHGGLRACAHCCAD